MSELKVFHPKKTNCPSVTGWCLMRCCSFYHCWQLSTDKQSGHHRLNIEPYRETSLEALNLESLCVDDVINTSLRFRNNKLYNLITQTVLRFYVTEVSF